jgi:hypothetical protein
MTSNVGVDWAEVSALAPTIATKIHAEILRAIAHLNPQLP